MVVLAAALALFVVVSADEAELESNPGTPDATDNCTAPFKLEKKHKVLQAALERKLEAEGWSKYIRQQTLAVAVVDLTRRGKRYYAGVNDDKMMYSASLPKIAILLTVIEAVNNGEIKWTHEFDKRLHEMITASSNQDASWGVDIVGLASIEKTMRDPKYCLYDNTYGGLWIGRAYRSGGATKPDPKADVSHGATARQAARFYTLLDAGQLVSKHWSFRMLGLMSPPKHFHKFVGGLSDRQGVVFLARKSGTWRHYHADSALIQHFDSRYVIAGLSETKDGEQIMRQLVRAVDDIIMAGVHRKTSKALPQAKR